MSVKIIIGIVYSLLYSGFDFMLISNGEVSRIKSLRRSLILRLVDLGYVMRCFSYLLVRIHIFFYTFIY